MFILKIFFFFFFVLRLRAEIALLFLLEEEKEIRKHSCLSKLEVEIIIDQQNSNWRLFHPFFLIFFSSYFVYVEGTNRSAALQKNGEGKWQNDVVFDI